MYVIWQHTCHAHKCTHDKILNTSTELSLTTEWAEDGDFQLPAPPTEPHSLPCSSLEWLEHNGLECKGIAYSLVIHTGFEIIINNARIML